MKGKKKLNKWIKICKIFFHNRYLKANSYKLQRILRAWKVGKIYFHMLIRYG